MATLAQHVPAVAADRRAIASAGAPRRIAWRQVAAELAFIAGLVATCAAFVALRMALLPMPVMPRDFAFTAFGTATAAAIAAFVAGARINRADTPSMASPARAAD